MPHALQLFQKDPSVMNSGGCAGADVLGRMRPRIALAQPRGGSLQGRLDGSSSLRWIFVLPHL